MGLKSDLPSVGGDITLDRSYEDYIENNGGLLVKDVTKYYSVDTDWAMKLFNINEKEANNFLKSMYYYLEECHYIQSIKKNE